MQGQGTDIRKLRYVLYARKSTEDENRQVRSIDDQIRDCKKVAENLGLHVVGQPIRETKSAKKPGQRPLFTQMLKDIEAGKYDAILCWHPDRLCRNMLEGGQIINMLDEGVLRDIRFQSHQFSNDANGKMLLGMLFVFSKQFSDDLSAKVSRGVTGNFTEGKSSGSPKWGYDRNELTGMYEPNDYFALIKQAWQMRAAGATLDTVASYLKENGYNRVTKDRRRRVIQPTKNSVSIMFRDPFYYGKLVQASQEVDLRQIYAFTPVTDEATFIAVQDIGYGRTQDVSKKKRAAFYPLRRFVYCAVCNGSSPMTVGKNRSGSGVHFLTYRCENKKCDRSPRSLRARSVFNSIYNVLDGFELTDASYELYSNELDGLTDSKVIEIKTRVSSLRGTVAHITSDLEKRALALGEMNRNSPAYEVNARYINDAAVRRTQAEQEIEELLEKIKNPSQIKLGKAEFLNLVKMASQKMKAGSAVEKDVLSRILFLNLRVDNEKVVDFIWNEPFASMIKAGEIISGADDRTRTYMTCVTSS